MSQRITGLYKVWQRFESSTWYRISQIAIVALSIGFMLRALVTNLAQIDSAGLQFNPAAFLIGLLLTGIAFEMGTLAWAEIIQALHPEMSYLQAIEYHLLSIATKYLPGVGWQQVSKALQLYRGGVPVGRTLLPVLLELGLIILTGLATALQMLSPTQQTIGVELGGKLHLGAVLSLWILCAVAPFAVQQFANGGISKPTFSKHCIFHLYLAELLDVVGWLAFGSALWFIIQGLVPLSFDALPYCIVTLTLSVVAGLVVIVVPNGYGIRELTMSTMLQAIVPLPASIIVALISRIVLVAAEFLGILPIIPISLLRRRK